MNTTTSADGTQIAYEQAGSGPTVVLVGGAFNDRGAWWALAQTLGELGFTAVTYDRRGRGDSGDHPNYSVDREIDDLRAVLNAVGGNEAPCAHGVSSGGALVLQAAAGGVDFARISVLEPPYRAAGAPPAPPNYVATLRRLIDASDRTGAVEYFMTAVVGLAPEAVTEGKSSPVWERLAKLAHTLLYDAQILGGDDHEVPADLLARVRVPVLAVSSSASAPWLARGAQAVADAVPDGRHQQYDGAFHDIAVEILAPALASFFSS